MCENCYNEKGRPAIVNKRTKAAADLISDVYEHHGAGGGLHVVVDDFNTDDSCVQFCKSYIESEDYRQNVSKARLMAEEKCICALAEMSEPERTTALAIHDGYLNF